MECLSGLDRLTGRDLYLTDWRGQIDFASIDVNKQIMEVQSHEQLGPYPYDALLIPSYKDHEIPAWENRGFVLWQKKYRYPEIRIANPRDYMVYMEKNYGASLPVLSGDLNNFTGDANTIDPSGQGWKREASRLLPMAEGAATVARALNPAQAPLGSRMRDAYQHMLDYDEHSWPTTPPPADIHRFNEQWSKHLEARRSLDKAKGLARDAIGALFQNVATGDAPVLAVFNPLAHARTDIVMVEGEFAGLVDVATGAAVPTQRVEKGKTAFIATDVPAFGYKTYRMATNLPAEAGSARVSAGPSSLSNEFYKLTFASSAGAISSLYDQKLARELLDPSAPYKFNQLVWVRKDKGESTTGTNYLPSATAKLSVRSGRVFADITADYEDASLGGAKIRQTVRLYAGLRRFDVVNELRHVGAFNGSYEERYRENIFYAFPLKVDDFTARAEYAGGVVRPHDDQLAWGSQDFLTANRWVDVSNSNFGVTMAPWNESTVHFGEIRYNQFSIDYKPTNSSLYSFAWSNRSSQTLTLDPEDLDATVGYSFAAHEGDWNSGGASRLGWGVASPLQARLLPAGQAGPLPAVGASFLAIDAPNVELVVLKESEQPGRGWIVRLVETAGKATTATLAFPGIPGTKAEQCDLVENDQRSLEVGQGQVMVPIRAFGYATVRLFTPGTELPAVEGVRTEAISDQSIRIEWQPTSGAAVYNIFRSDDPAAPAAAYSLVGRTATLTYTDSRLNLGTHYYYFVAAVTANNMQGPVSSQSNAWTLDQNTSPPSPVPELDVVRQPNGVLMVTWWKSPEPDVARYRLYRGETADFVANDRSLIALVNPGKYYLVRYSDQGLTSGQTYYYRVLPEDWAANRQTQSPVASGIPSHSLQ